MTATIVLSAPLNEGPDISQRTNLTHEECPWIFFVIHEALTLVPRPLPTGGLDVDIVVRGRPDRAALRTLMVELLEEMP